MSLTIQNKKVYIASEPVNFRMSIDKLSQIVQKNVKNYLHDGSIYVFHNKARDKIKLLFWDRNGFVLYYKKLEGTRFKLGTMSNLIENVSLEKLEVILSGYDPDKVKKEQLTLEHQTG